MRRDPGKQAIGSAERYSPVAVEENRKQRPTMRGHRDRNLATGLWVKELIFRNNGHLLCRVLGETKP